jgi:hypothetical protein
VIVDPMTEFGRVNAPPELTCDAEIREFIHRASEPILVYETEVVVV